jgi:hypothetical protein
MITALDFLSHFRITQNGYVTFQLYGQTVGAGAAMQFTYHQAIVFQHPDNEKIEMIGATMMGPMPTSDAGYALVGYGSGQRAADVAANLTMLRTKFATELHFIGSSGIYIRGMGIGGASGRGIDGILCTGDGTPAYGLNIDIATIITCNMGLAFVGFGQSANNGYGVAVTNGAGVIFGGVAPLLSMGSGSYGIALADASAFTNANIVMSFSNGADGVVMFTGSGWQNDLQGAWNYFECNYGNGIAQFGAGYYIGGSGTYTYCNNNYSFGLAAYDGSTIGGLGQVFSVGPSGSGYSAKAAGMSLIDLGPNSYFSQPSTPPLNTLGNTNAIVWAGNM